jgi:hypothetical protein
MTKNCPCQPPDNLFFSHHQRVEPRGPVVAALEILRGREWDGGSGRVLCEFLSFLLSFFPSFLLISDILIPGCFSWTDMIFADLVKLVHEWNQLQAHPDLNADPNDTAVYLTYTKNDKRPDGTTAYSTPLYRVEWE